MKNHCGFRIEVKPKSKLGKRLSNLSIYLRNRSDAVGDVKAKRRCTGTGGDIVVGVWTVRKSGVISFKGTSKRHGQIEYVYGKLTIGENLDSPGHQEPLPYHQSTQLFLKLINLMFPYLDASPLTLNLKLTRKD